MHPKISNALSALDPRPQMCSLAARLRHSETKTKTKTKDKDRNRKSEKPRRGIYQWPPIIVPFHQSFPRFLDLPREVRLLIYEYVLGGGHFHVTYMNLDAKGREKMEEEKRTRNLEHLRNRRLGFGHVNCWSGLNDRPEVGRTENCSCVFDHINKPHWSEIRWPFDFVRNKRPGPGTERGMLALALTCRQV